MYHNQEVDIHFTQYRIHHNDRSELLPGHVFSFDRSLVPSKGLSCDFFDLLTDNPIGQYGEISYEVAVYDELVQ